MYYIRLSEEDPNSIVYYCRNCGHENKNISLDSVTISKTSSCTSNEEQKEKEREIIYLRYDDVNMNFVYMCSTCDTVWNTEQSMS